MKLFCMEENKMSEKDKTWSRRDFLKATGAAGLGAIMAPADQLAEAGQPNLVPTRSFGISPAKRPIHNRPPHLPVIARLPGTRRVGSLRYSSLTRPVPRWKWRLRRLLKPNRLAKTTTKRCSLGRTTYSRIRFSRLVPGDTKVVP